MTLTVNHPGNLSLSQLQNSLWRAELNLRKLVTIGIGGNQTVSEHDNTIRVPHRSLRLVEDPNGNVPAPSGTDPGWVCRGEALIGGQQKKVAAFRLAAVQTVAAAPAAPAAPSPAPAQPVSDGPGDTGPEGNPLLNSDGTPRTGAPPAPPPPAARPDDEPTGGAGGG